MRLNGADGFEVPTVCQCDFLYALPKSALHSALGPVSWERQPQLKNRLKEVLRLYAVSMPLEQEQTEKTEAGESVARCSSVSSCELVNGYG